ncbi:hypothetical protein GCM10010973_38510 [Cribrihabitans marinus]|nr:hypothetical protein GCM10010973_38510 [Cribrihabitans marinus]
MGGQIYHMADEFIAGQAGQYDGQSEDEAASALAASCRRYLEAEGWNPADYGVDLNQLALDGLRRHRNA